MKKLFLILSLLTIGCFCFANESIKLSKTSIDEIVDVINTSFQNGNKLKNYKVNNSSITLNFEKNKNNTYYLVKSKEIKKGSDYLESIEYYLERNIHISEVISLNKYVIFIYYIPKEEVLSL